MKTCPTCGRQYAETNTLCPLDGAVLKRSGHEDQLIGQVLAGKYRIEEKLDEGGMGCVYRATHVLMEKTDRFNTAPSKGHSVFVSAYCLSHVGHAVPFGRG